MSRCLSHFFNPFNYINYAVRLLETRFPRLYPGSPGGKCLSGDEQLRIIRNSLSGSLEYIGVQLMPYDHSCTVCNTLADKVYPLESPPPIPVSGCPYVDKCRAIYVPVIHYELYKISQVLAENPAIKGRELRKLLQREAKNKRNRGKADSADGRE